MNSIFEEATYASVLERIAAIDANTEKQWGKMNAAQMFHHCQFPLALAMGRETLKKPNFLMKMVMKSFKTSMYNDKPWKQGNPTVKKFKVTEEKNLEEEKEKLTNLVKDFHQEKTRTAWESHPAFGEFTHDQWGKMQYKHLDHHLRQFGV